MVINDLTISGFGGSINLSGIDGSGRVGGGVEIGGGSNIENVENVGGSGSGMGSSGGAGGSVSVSGGSSVISIVSSGGPKVNGLVNYGGAGGSVSVSGGSSSTSIISEGGVAISEYSSDCYGGVGGIVDVTDSSVSEIINVNGGGAYSDGSVAYGGVGGDINFYGIDVDLSGVSMSVDAGFGASDESAGTIKIDYSNSFVDNIDTNYGNWMHLVVVNSHETMGVADGGKIEWDGIIDSSEINGNGLSSYVGILFRYIFADSVFIPSFNSMAYISFYGSPGVGFDEPVILKDGSVCGGSCIGPIGGDWGADVLEFIISDFSEYEIAESPMSYQLQLSPELGTAVVWSDITGAGGVYDVGADGNNGVGNTLYWIDVETSGTTVDLYISATGDLVLDGGEDSIPLEDESYVYDLTFPHVPPGDEFSLTTENVLIAGGLEDGDRVYFKFYLDAPDSHLPGSYSNNLIFVATPTP